MTAAPRKERRRRSALKIRAELVLVVVCIGIIAAGPLAIEGAKVWVIVWTALSNMASYIKGRLEPSLDEPPHEPQDVKIINEKKDAVPTTTEPAPEEEGA